MAKGNGTTRVSGSRGSRESAMALYDFWLRGGSNTINRQIDASFAPSFFDDGVRRDLNLLDTVFEPAENDLQLYKGVPDNFALYAMRQTGAKGEDDLVGKSFVDKFYSSTSENTRAARDYAYRNEEAEDVSILHFSVKKGTPVARAVGYTDQETTLRRNLRYTIRRIRREQDEDGTTIHHFYIDISRP